MTGKTDDSTRRDSTWDGAWQEPIADLSLLDDGPEPTEEELERLGYAALVHEIICDIEADGDEVTAAEIQRRIRLGAALQAAWERRTPWAAWITAASLVRAAVPHIARAITEIAPGAPDAALPRVMHSLVGEVLMGLRDQAERLGRVPGARGLDS